MISPVHSAYGFAPRRSPANLSTSALNLTRSLSDASSNNDQSSIATRESSFKDEHEEMESALRFEGKAGSNTPLSIYTIPDADVSPRKTKRFLPDPPEDASISEVSEITSRSLAVTSTMDDLSASGEGSSKLGLSIQKMKRRLRAVPSAAPTAEQLMRARDLEALKVLAKRISASVDPSMTLYLERTLYAALQQSWLLGFGGVGVMTVGSDSKDAINLGIMLISLSLISAISALVLHHVRLSQIKSGKPFKFWHTFLFTSLLTICILTAIALEMHYGVLYPYLLRTTSVKALNPEVLRGSKSNNI